MWPRCHTVTPIPTVNDRGKVNVGKVWQDNLAFRMNASSREVLRKCLKGVIITEPNIRRWRISRWRSTGTKRVRAGVDLRLSAIDTTNVNRFRGRKREDPSKKSQAIQIYQIYGKESTYAWEMHEHVTCKIKSIMDSAQSNPISTQAYYTHLIAWKYH